MITDLHCGSTQQLSINSIFMFSLTILFQTFLVCNAFLLLGIPSAEWMVVKELFLGHKQPPQLGWHSLFSSVPYYINRWIHEGVGDSNKGMIITVPLLCVHYYLQFPLTAIFSILTHQCPFFIICFFTVWCPNTNTIRL